MRRHKDKQNEAIEPEVDPEQDQRTVLAYKRIAHEFFKIRSVPIVLISVYVCMPMKEINGGVESEGLDDYSILIREEHKKDNSSGISVFVTNFPNSFGSRDLWSLCEEYGKVVDVFIPNRKSKAGKRFAFVRFIRVDDMDRLIGNLCTLWVGRLHLQANAVRYERPPKSSPSIKLPSVKSYDPFTSSPSDIKNVPPHSSPVLCSPALVLDDTCVNVLDLSGQVMGITKDVNSISNLRNILTNEGFMDVKLSYLGGLWDMIELNSEETKMKLLQHNGVNSWFEELKPASQEFVCNERIVWVDIERIPLYLWSSSTFSRIGMKWGTVMDIEESPGSSFAHKRLCIKTSMADPGYLSEDESSLDGNNNLDNSQQGNVNQVEGSDVEEANSHHSDDPFGLYDLLRTSTNLFASKEDSSLSHPPKFTPVASHQDPIHSNSPHLEVNQDEPPITKGSPSKSYPKASCFSQASHGNESSADSSTHVSSRYTPKGGSILEVLDGMIKVGRLMGYDMEGCSKDIEQIISDSIGNLGGILCVWEETIFKKVGVSISDNFIALYGIWLPTNSKILTVVIYAPQYFSLKRILWYYISGLITRWNGETIVLGDFNEVRSEDERFGSIFHQSYAREFNHFISSSGLLEVKMEGYSFTWSHSSASKMSKLDRFLVSE
nr:RNA-directed DNA polymerase, eukaryota, nucleotide-binding alpha-beta plait domain protein [Tanacetum cinerariifolium]